jgi:hypothetical protein
MTIPRFFALCPAFSGLRIIGSKPLLPRKNSLSATVRKPRVAWCSTCRCRMYWLELQGMLGQAEDPLFAI